MRGKRSTLDSLLVRVFMLTLEFLCVGLAFILAYLFLKLYNTRRSIFLLGLPFGFFFLLVSYFFLGVHMLNSTFYNLPFFSSSLMWVRVVTQTVGFTLMALSYVVAGRFQGTSRRSYLIILLRHNCFDS